jgi:hypothetical protein
MAETVNGGRGNDTWQLPFVLTTLRTEDPVQIIRQSVIFLTLEIYNRSLAKARDLLFF